MTAPQWSRSHRNFIVLLVAMAVAAYQMLQLEQRRSHFETTVDQEYDKAVGLLRAFFAHEQTAVPYSVVTTIRISSHPETAVNTAALIVNRAPRVPRIEAELVVDQGRLQERRKQAVASKQATKHRSTNPVAATQPHPVLIFRVYDTGAPAIVRAAKLLEQRALATSEYTPY